MLSFFGVKAVFIHLHEPHLVEAHSPSLGRQQKADKNTIRLHHRWEFCATRFSSAHIYPIIAGEVCSSPFVSQKASRHLSWDRYKVLSFSWGPSPWPYWKAWAVATMAANTTIVARTMSALFICWSSIVMYSRSDSARNIPSRMMTDKHVQLQQHSVMGGVLFVAKLDKNYPAQGIQMTKKYPGRLFN